MSLTWRNLGAIVGWLGRGYVRPALGLMELEGRLVGLEGRLLELQRPIVDGEDWENREDKSRWEGGTDVGADCVHQQVHFSGS